MISPEEALTRLEGLLADAGYKADAPDPAVAWRVFKQFAELEVECSDDAILWQCGVYDFTGQEEFHWDMTRQFTFEEDGEYDHMEQLNFTILFEPNPELRGFETNAWSFDSPDLQAFFRRVEQLPEFRVPLERHRPRGTQLLQGVV